MAAMNAKQTVKKLTLSMKRPPLLTSLVTAGMLAVLAAGCASQAQLEAQAKVSRADAEKIALAKVPNGTVKEAELEKEKGRLVWSFDLTTPGTADITEILVDAKTGEIVATETETPAAQAKEAQEKEKEKSGQSK
jgi:uncharacterized membrane protein YkoI